MCDYVKIKKECPNSNTVLQMSQLDDPSKAIQSIQGKDWDSLSVLIRDSIENDGGKMVIESLMKTYEVLSDQWGLFRRAFFHAFSIPEFIYTSVGVNDVLTRLNELQSVDWDFQVFDTTLKVMEENVRNGNTYFIDLSRLKKTRLAHLIPSIVNERAAELKSLAEEPVSLSDIAQTYYGYLCVTSSIRNRECIRKVEAFLEQHSISSSTISSLIEPNLMLEDIKFENVGSNESTLLQLGIDITSNNSNVRKMAAAKMGTIGDLRAEPFLRRSVNDEYSWVRMASVQSLAQLCLPETADILDECLEDFDENIREIAVRGLIDIGSPAKQQLRNRMQAEMHFDFESAVSSLDIAHPRSLDNLLAAISYRQKNALICAIRVMAQIGGSSDLLILENLSKAEDVEIRMSSRDAMAAIEKRMKNAD